MLLIEKPIAIYLLTLDVQSIPRGGAPAHHHGLGGRPLLLSDPGGLPVCACAGAAWRAGWLWGLVLFSFIADKTFLFLLALVLVSFQQVLNDCLRSSLGCVSFLHVGILSSSCHIKVSCLRRTHEGIICGRGSQGGWCREREQGASLWPAPGARVTPRWLAWHVLLSCLWGICARRPAAGIMLWPHGSVVPGPHVPDHALKACVQHKTLRR